MNIIKYIQRSEAWKIQITDAINFTPSKDTGEEHKIRTTSDNVKFMSYDVNDVVNKLFDSLLPRYQDNLGTSMRGSYIVFDSVQLMHYKCCKVKVKKQR